MSTYSPIKIISVLTLTILLAFKPVSRVNHFLDGDFEIADFNAVVNCQSSIVPFPSPSGNFWVTADKTHYAVNETITFTVQSNSSGAADYLITENLFTQVDDFVTPLEEGTVNLVADQPTTITVSLDHPGFLYFSINQSGNTAKTGIGIDACLIQPLTPAPNDFDQFWNTQKQRLAQVPMNENLVYRSDKSTYHCSVYKMELDNIDGKKVYGWFSIPNCDGPFPAILNLPSYGSQSIGTFENTYFGQLGAITVSISIHDYDCESSVPGSIAYEPDDHFESKYTNYFKASLMGCVRAIDYIFSRPEFDGYNLAATGISQGGGLAIMIAGLDSRVKYLAQSLPTFGEQSGLIHNRASGFPFWLKKADDLGMDVHKIKDSLAYYDGAHFADRFVGPSLNAISYNDEICPPATCFAAVNQLRGIKEIIHEINTGHNSPSFWGNRQSFFQSYLPLNPYPSCPLEASVLPIELIEWKGNRHKNGNKLSWKTSQETHTDYFIIEATGKNGIFEEVGKVKASGESNLTKAYEFIHEFPAPKTYYRLKTKYIDGSHEYSESIYIANNETINLSTKVWPNPFQSEISITISEKSLNPSIFTLYHTSGKVMFQETLESSSPKVTFSTKNLASGFYFYTILNTGQLVQGGKLIKD